MTPRPLHLPSTAAALAFALIGLCMPANAQPTQAQQSAIRSACPSDFRANCSGVQPRRPGGADLPAAEHGEALARLPIGRRRDRWRRRSRAGCRPGHDDGPVTHHGSASSGRRRLPRHGCRRRHRDAAATALDVGRQAGDLGQADAGPAERHPLRLPVGFPRQLRRRAARRIRRPCLPAAEHARACRPPVRRRSARSVAALPRHPPAPRRLRPPSRRRWLARRWR